MCLEWTARNQMNESNWRLTCPATCTFFLSYFLYLRSYRSHPVAEGHFPGGSKHSWPVQPSATWNGVTKIAPRPHHCLSKCSVQKKNNSYCVWWLSASAYLTPGYVLRRLTRTKWPFSTSGKGPFLLPPTAVNGVLLWQSGGGCVLPRPGRSGGGVAWFSITFVVSWHIYILLFSCV